MFGVLKCAFALIVFFATLEICEGCPCKGPPNEQLFYLVMEYPIKDGGIRRWTLQGEKGLLEAGGLSGLISGVLGWGKSKTPELRAVDIDIGSTTEQYIIVANHWFPKLSLSTVDLIAELYAEFEKIQKEDTTEMTMGITRKGAEVGECNDRVKLIHDNPNQLKWKKLEFDKTSTYSMANKTATVVFNVVDKPYVFRDKISGS